MPSPYFMNHSVTLERPTPTKDAAGGPLRSWATVVSGVAASIQPLTAAVISLYGARQVAVSHAVYTNEPLVYRRGDRLVTETGRYFSVAAELDQVGAGMAWRYDCQELLA